MPLRLQRPGFVLPDLWSQCLTLSAEKAWHTVLNQHIDLSTDPSPWWGLPLSHGQGPSWPRDNGGARSYLSTALPSSYPSHVSQLLAKPVSMDTGVSLWWCQPYPGSLHEGAWAPKQNPQACSPFTIPLQALRQSMLFCWNSCLGEPISGKPLLYALIGGPPGISWVFWWPHQLISPLIWGSSLLAPIL